LLKRIKVETMEEIAEMKAALADAHMDYCLESAFLEIACERLETTVEDLKRKNDITLAGRRKRRGRFEIPAGYRAIVSEAGYEPAELLQAADAAGSGRGLIERLVRGERAEA
jgi:hypothetical protein